MSSFKPIHTSNSPQSNNNQVNDMIRQLNKEQTTKVFKGGTGNAIINGRLPNGKYGSLYYDTNGDARILIGQHPVTGAMGMWVTVVGVDVIEELST